MNEILEEIERLETLKKQLDVKRIEVEEEIQVKWGMFAAEERGVMPGTIVVSNGVRYIAKRFKMPRNGVTPTSDKLWLYATLESDTSDDKEIYNLYNNWQKVEKTA